MVIGRRPLGSIPSPSDGILHLGPLPSTCTGCCSPSAWSSRRGWPSGAGRGGATTADELADIVGLGRDRRRRRRAAVPRRHRLPALRGRLASGRSRSGRAGSSIWGAVLGGAIAVVVIVPRQAPRHACGSATRSRPGCSSPRRSVAGATSSTRSCSGSRRRCRGVSRSTRRTARRATRSTRPSTRRSSTSRSTASPLLASCSGSSDASALRRGQLFALYVVHVHVRPVLVREPAHRRRAPRRGAARERVGEHRRRASSVSRWFVWLGRHRSGRRGGRRGRYADGGAARPPDRVTAVTASWADRHRSIP